MSAIQVWPVILGAAWLIATTFVFYRRAHAGEDVRLAAVYREGLRRTPALLAWAAILILALWLTLRPSAPRWIWIVVPMLLLPLGARMSAEGLRGLFRNVWRGRYFVQFALLVVIGVLLPYELMRWHPGLEWLSGGAYGPEASPLTTAVLVVLFVWLMWKAPIRRQTPYLLRDRWDEAGGPQEPVEE